MFTDDFQRMCRDLRVLVVAPYDIRNLQDLLCEYHLDAERQSAQVKIICLLAVHHHSFANQMTNADPHRLIFHSRQNNEVTTTHYDPEAIAEYCGQHGIEALPCDQETLANVGRLKTCLLEKFERCVSKEDAAAAVEVEKPASGSAHNRFRLCPPPGHKSSKPRFPVSTKPPCSIL